MSASLTAEQITIAVTAYDRRQYLKQAIRSALNQTLPVRVLVVEDCGPDPALRDFVEEEFGSRVQYIRNRERRGILGNWNACVDFSPTPWLSILHDDDYLAPGFIAAMLELHQLCPGCGLYFGGTTMVNERGEPLWEWLSPATPQLCRQVTSHDIKWATPFPFPGQLFPVEDARAVGGFRETSQYGGDWEMWCKLVARFGGACTRVSVAFYRQHGGWERCSNRVARAGKEYPLNYVQLKRALHLLRQAGVPEKVDRAVYQRRRPVPTRFLLRHGVNLSPRLLAYHRRLLLLSTSPHMGYTLFQIAVRIFGVLFLRRASAVWNWLFPVRRA
jgi:glycosyltransferase involved in cell wall biosynthesis